MTKAAYNSTHNKNNHGPHAMRLSSSSSYSKSSSCALGQLKKETTEQQSSNPKRHHKGALPAAASAAASPATSASARGAVEGHRAGSDVVKEYMEKKFFSKFKPQRSQRLRLRCRGVQQRQQQQLVIPARKPAGVKSDQRANKKAVQKNKNSFLEEKRKSVSYDPRTLRKVCSEALAQLGVL